METTAFANRLQTRIPATLGNGTQGEWADRLHIPRSTLSSYMTGKKLPTAKGLASLILALGDEGMTEDWNEARAARKKPKAQARRPVVGEVQEARLLPSGRIQVLVEMDNTGTVSVGQRVRVALA